MSRRTATSLLAIVFAVWTVAMSAAAPQASTPRTGSEASDSLMTGFRSPPGSARPRVWWHWMNGNVTRDGIAKDLDWLASVGVAGVQNFDGALDTPQVVGERLAYMSPGWQDAFRDAVQRARAGNLEFAIATSPGWSETGGPWVRPEQAMKKFVWSETLVEGGSVGVHLTPPSSVTGPFQNVPGGGAEPSSDERPDLPRVYRDTAVIAWRMPADGYVDPSITASSPIDAAKLADGDLVTPVVLPFEGSNEVWIAASFPRPQTLRGVQLALGSGTRIGPLPPPWPVGRIEASDDNRSFRTIALLPPRGNIQQTVAFPATTARYFRVVLERRFGPVAVAAFDRPQTPPIAHRVMELRFLPEARVNRFEDKAGFSIAAGLQDYRTPDYATGDVIGPGSTLDLTGKLRPDGSLDWKAPPGRWRVVRFGWSLTGKLNNPASPEATGLEVDKLNAADVSAYARTYLGNYQRMLGRDNLGDAGIAAMVTDSYEAMSANWTDDILDQFRARRGYDPRPWLPVLAGYVVSSSEKSDAFLWDFRRTLADLIAEAHYDTLTAVAHSVGMVRYGESHEGLRAFVGDGMETKKSADIPMGAAWAGELGIKARYVPDILESAAVAHLYGQNIVAAESFTAIMPAYAFPPEVLKSTADKMMANGVNRFVIHTSVHQPVDREGPGIGLGPFGQWFTRKETWSAMARPWIDYLSRSSFLLQRGRFVGDIAYFYGEDENITAVFNDRQPVIPPGFAFDFVNADSLRSTLVAANGRLSSPSGASYRILVIDRDAHRITVPVLRAIHAFVRAGGAVVGRAPVGSPSLADDPAEFTRLVTSIWSSPSVYPTIAAASAARGIEPDLSLGAAGAGLSYVHRTAPDEDIYFVANGSDRQVSTTASFRLAGRNADLWRADDGSVRPLSFDTVGGRTAIRLDLRPHDAVFVVFRGHSATGSRRVPTPRDVYRLDVQGPWTVDFPEASGNPARALTMRTLASWTASGDPAIRYFSGTARYSGQFFLPASARKSAARWMLDLGAVRNLADVRLNGCEAGIAWKAPFVVDISSCVRAGRNLLEVRVANLWPNRLIGDKQPGYSGARVFATFNPYEAGSPLLPSGLLGPVTISASR